MKTLLILLLTILCSNTEKNTPSNNIENLAQTQNSQTPLPITQSRLNIDSRHFLEDNDIAPVCQDSDNPLYKDFYNACYNNNSKEIKHLLKNPKTNPNKPNKNGITPIYIASQEGHTTIVKLLLQDKQVNPSTPNKDG